MCTILLPPGVNPIAVKYIIIYRVISYIMFDGLGLYCCFSYKLKNNDILKTSVFLNTVIIIKFHVVLVSFLLQFLEGDFAIMVSETYIYRISSSIAMVAASRTCILGVNT
jgi:hypothetical protein